MKKGFSNHHIADYKIYNNKKTEFQLKTILNFGRGREKIDNESSLIGIKKRNVKFSEQKKKKKISF